LILFMFIPKFVFFVRIKPNYSILSADWLFGF